MNNLKEELLGKIEDKSLVVGVVGLGYVGLPLAVEKAKAGYTVIGFDVQPEKVQMVNDGVNYIGDVVDSELKAIVESGKLRATSDFESVASCDFIAIAVPTPLDIYQQPDISYVEKSTTDVSKHLKKGSIVVLESTTYPGTTEELMRPILENGSGLKCEEDFYLAFSPERVDPGNKQYKTKNTPKVVGGIGSESTEVAAALYRNVLEGEVMTVSSPRVAEMEKILENTYRNVNIGLVNEFAKLANKMDINMWEVVDAEWVVDRSMKILSRKFKKPLNGSKVLILGIAYKKDIDDLRDSPAFVVMDKFREEGAIIDYYDGFNPSYFNPDGSKTYSLKEINPEVVKGYDLVVITADHTNVDYQMVVDNAPFVFDTKYATRNVENNKDKIELL